MAYDVGSYLSGATAIVSYFTKGTDKPEQALDPLATIIRLALLSREVPHTKLSISNNTISFIPPGAGTATRTLSNLMSKVPDTRADLILLKKPISLVFTLWPAHEDEDMKKFYEAAKKAYENFKNVTYADWTGGIKEESIDVVIKLIDNELANPKPAKKLNDIEKKIKDVWTERQVQAAATLFALGDKDSDEALKKFLVRKDRDFKDTIKSLVSP